MKITIKKVLCCVAVVLFVVLFILNGAEQAMIKSEGTEDYKNLQSQYVAPDKIHSVIYDDESKLLYVGYSLAPCVNVYSYDGEFMWSVMTENIGACYYDVIDNSLIIYNVETAYIYDCKSGSFIEKTNPEELDLSYEYRGNYVSLEDMSEGDLYFDDYQVYEMSSVGTLDVIVDCPAWFVWFDYSLILVIAVAVLFFTVATMTTVETMTSIDKMTAIGKRQNRA